MSPATSLGGVETTTIGRRGKLSGRVHVPPGLLLLSVDCEHVEDLWDDLAVTLDRLGHSWPLPVLLSS